MIIRLGLALLLLSAFQAPPQPQPPRPSAMVVGQVIDAGTGRPVAGAIVSLGPASNPQSPRVLTGSDGRFVFRDLRRGEHTITVSKPGYVEGAYGRNRPGGPVAPLTLNENERVGDAVIRIWKHAAISGTVTDESGERLVGVQLRAFRRAVAGGRRRFIASSSATTDDRGIYRIATLMPGDYIVAAIPRQTAVPLSLYRNRPPGAPAGNPLAEAGIAAPADTPGLAVVEAGNAGIVLGRGSVVPPPSTDGRLLVYPTTFHPSTTSGGSGAVITIRSGEEYPNADLQLTPVPTASVSGFVYGPDGPVKRALLRLVPADTLELASELDLPTTLTDAGGAFTLPAVPSGHYTIRLNAVGPGPFWLDEPISVGTEHIEGLALMVSTGLKLSGRLEFEGDLSRSRGSLSNIPILIEPAEVVPSSAAYFARPSTSGEFVSMPVPPGRYYIRVPNSPAGWMFKSATIDGRDVVDTPFRFSQEPTQVVITFTDRWSGVRGAVQSTTGRDAEAVVVVFPNDREAWGSTGMAARRLRMMRASKIGEYSFNLPPGEYFVIAIPEAQSADWQDPDFLDSASRVASRVSIGDGERKIQDLQTRVVR
jgi:hypothetical protein